MIDISATFLSSLPLLLSLLHKQNTVRRTHTRLDRHLSELCLLSCETRSRSEVNTTCRHHAQPPSPPVPRLFVLSTLFSVDPVLTPASAQCAGQWRQCGESAQEARPNEIHNHQPSPLHGTRGSSSGRQGGEELKPLWKTRASWPQFASGCRSSGNPPARRSCSSSDSPPRQSTTGGAEGHRAASPRFNFFCLLHRR